MILGVVLAGGQSSRFGSDKADARLGSSTLLELTVDQLRAICDDVVVAGRDRANVPVLADWPRPGMGPLGGIAAGLRYAAENRFQAILSSGVDSIALPENLIAMLSPAPAFLKNQPVIGHWPTKARDALEMLLMTDSRHSMRAFADAIEARAVEINDHPANINTPADLANAEKRYGF